MNCNELLGYDTYSNETFICGTYRHYSSAWRAMKKAQFNSLESQGECLRDTYWIVKKDIKEQTEEIERRQEHIRTIRDRMNADMESVMTQMADIYVFARETIDSPGLYTYPLPESLVMSDITSINFILKRRYRSRTKYELSIYVKFRDVGECVGVTLALAWGTVEDIRAEMHRPETSLKYVEVIFRAVRRHYRSLL